MEKADLKLPPSFNFFAFDINNSEFMQLYRNICRLDDIGLNSYISLCQRLLLNGQSFCEYVHDTLIFSEQPLIERYIQTEEPALLSAVRCDVSRIKKICGLSAADIKGLFSNALGIDISDFPEYDLGEFPYTAEYFTRHCRKNGCGIFARYKAFRYSQGEIVPIESPDPIRLSDLKQYEIQRGQIIDNTLCLINGRSANNVLLYGDRGTGKSSTVKALLNEYETLRMIQLDKNQLSSIFELYDKIRAVPLHFIIFIDDLSFSEDDDGFFVLKQALDGSLAAKPDNTAIYATTNRRHIIKETAANRADSFIHKSDAVDNNMSLSDRFGLFITFTAPNKEQFNDIAKKIALDRGINVNSESFEAGLERFALKRGGRSPRIAKQYVETLEAKLSLGLTSIDNP